MDVLITFMSDTILHSWEVIAEILQDKRCMNIIIDIGMPVMHKNVTYNCRVLILNGKIILIRPKKKLCDSAMYRESRWFTAWSKDYCIESFILPNIIQNISGQITVPIGDAILFTSDTSIGFEICEELWNPESSLIKQYSSGVEITVNSSGGFHEIGRTNDVINVIKSATKKCGGVYIFSNLRGCDGDLMYYHGTSHITVNGNITAIGEQFSLKDVEVVISTVDLDDVVTHRRTICKLDNRGLYPQIDVEYCITSYSEPVIMQDSFADYKVYSDGEEIALGPACWLWDYLRRSNFSSILLPLKGDINSCSSAVIIYSMCDLICRAIEDGNLSVLYDLRKILNDSEYKPSNPKELCHKILITCDLDAESSKNQFVIDSKDLAVQIGSNHFDVPIENVILALLNVFIITFVGIFRIEKSKIMMAVQANRERIQMIILYIFAEMLSLKMGFQNRILVLGISDCDNVLLGNYVKYGCFSGDLSLTGSINKENLKTFLNFSRHYFQLTTLDNFFRGATDEKLSSETIGTIEEINLLCKLKKDNCGPYSSFCKLALKYKKDIELIKFSKQVKSFFHLYSLHSSKKFSIAPCLHLGLYAIVNHYYDQHQFLYNADWNWQFSAIDRELNLILSTPRECNSERLKDNKSSSYLEQK